MIRTIEDDCLHAMALMDDNSIDAIVTDPPYGLEFMGNDWDRPWAVGSTQPGYTDGSHRLERPVHGDNRNATCATCGGRMRGANRCSCDTPEWKPTGGFRRTGNPADVGRDNVFGRTSATSPEYKMTMHVMTGDKDRGPGGLPYGPGTNSRGFADIKDSMPLYQAWCYEWATECLRVLKPGGHLISFGGTRTYHRLACAIEDAGFEIRDSLHWLYGSGFPKSLNVAKAIDKAARGKPQGGPNPDSPNSGKYSPIPSRGAGPAAYAPGLANPDFEVTDPDAIAWEGWGTGLKPGHEPIVLARKPMRGTVASNVLKDGTGALNIDGTRLEKCAQKWDTPRGGIWKTDPDASSEIHTNDKGRWPPNVLLTHSADCQVAGWTKIKGTPAGSVVMHRSSADQEGNNSAAYGAENRKDGWVCKTHGDPDGTETVEVWDCAPGCPVAEIDAQSGYSKDGVAVNRNRTEVKPHTVFGTFGGAGTPDVGYGGGGGASRFYPSFRYQAKAPPKERPSAEGIKGHPTVKPLALMKWLVTLITPPGGLVLDPFAGTGTTGQACRELGFRCIMIERDPEYIQLIHSRLDTSRRVV